MTASGHLATRLTRLGRTADRPRTAAVEEGAAMFLVVSLYPVPLTAGIPILLSVAAAVALTYSRKRVASA